MDIGNNYEAYLYGLCCKELKLYKQAEENLLIADNFKQNDLNTLGQLYQVYQVNDLSKAFDLSKRIITLMEAYLFKTKLNIMLSIKIDSLNDLLNYSI